VLVDVLFDPFGGSWADIRAGALAAEQAGFDGVWLYDHLAGSVHGASRVVECWTTLTAIAATVPRLSIGPLVLNVANRDAGTLAVMAATLQEVSEGRLLLGLGAGGGLDTPYAAEQIALGRTVPGARVRRQWVEDAVSRVRDVWTGSVGGATGFLRPRPTPPIIIGGFGPKMAELAGRLGDGINVPGGGHMDKLVEIARDAHARAGRDPAEFIVTASSGPRGHQRLADLGVARVIIFVRPPYAAGVAQVHAALN
jgi:alkanesulfonate monooxygenase SsuD/methylene tetrahydromethanopterin reductase-like flavin-dependent oxidoreductase (luciferase family)